MTAAAEYRSIGLIRIANRISAAATLYVISGSGPFRPEYQFAFLTGFRSRWGEFSIVSLDRGDLLNGIDAQVERAVRYIRDNSK